MQIATKAVISEIYKSEKSGRQYVTFVDLDDGGQFKLVFEGELIAKEGQIVDVAVVVKARIVQGGGVTLTFTRGTISPDGKPKKEGGDS